MGISWHPNSVLRTSNYFTVEGQVQPLEGELRSGKLLGMPKIKLIKLTIREVF